jgi:hypothetical protein
MSGAGIIVSRLHSSAIGGTTRASARLRRTTADIDSIAVAIVQHPYQVVRTVFVSATRSTANTFALPDPTLRRATEVSVGPQQELPIITHCFADPGE